MLRITNRYLLICLGITIFKAQCLSAPIMNNNPDKEDWQCKILNEKWNCQRSEKLKSVFDRELTTNQKKKILANDLGWVEKPSYFSGGYYNNDSQFTKDLCESKKIDVGYEKAEFNNNETLIASGNVAVIQCDQEIYGDNAIVNFDKGQSSIKSLLMIGGVVAKQPSTGVVLRTKDFGINMSNKTYSAGETYFRMAKKVPNTRIYDKEHFSGHFRGYAKSFKREDSDNLILEDGYVTSGDPYDNDWKIAGDNINIDTKKKVMYIKNGFFEIKDIPVIYVPYLSYSISDKRKSGFLKPKFIENTNAGYGVYVPYYFNLAPNYDLFTETILWSKRGLMENATFRYMTDYFQGQLKGSIVPYDFEKKAIRGAFSISNSNNFDNGITTDFSYDYVSDEQYYNDFAAGEISLSSKSLLDRRFSISYINNYINLDLTLLTYTAVNPDLTISNRPYAKLPELKFDLELDGYTPDYLTFSFNTLNTFFYKPSASNTSSLKQSTSVNTFRAYESIRIAANFSKDWGYLKPSLQVPMRFYRLNNKATDAVKFNQSSVTSILPIFNIDTGIYFDREYTTKGGKYIQTLNPRLFYTFIPYQDQTNIPLFDTNLQSQEYTQMFRVNRFSGHDRINNANQISYALEASTTDQDSGEILASAKIGQMIYFSDRKVSLCQGSSKCPNPHTMGLFSKSTFSVIMSSFALQATKNISLSASLNYRTEQNNIDYQVYRLSYKDENENIFNISYDNIANSWSSLTQQQINDGIKPPARQSITLSTILNVADHWNIAAFWNYDFQQKKVASVFAGLQYNAKSWAIRALWQGNANNSLDPNDPLSLGSLVATSIIEFEIKGIGGFGEKSELYSNLSSITGYETGQWGEI